MSAYNFIFSGQVWNWIWELCLRWPAFRRRVVRYWYDVVALIDSAGEVRFMNYGYVDPHATDRIGLHPAEEANRYQIQLYHRVASQVDLRHLQVLEVGSGRGGGAAYICAHLHPQLLIGVDISSQAIQFCGSVMLCPTCAFCQAMPRIWISLPSRSMLC
jgi:hypothetical protein